MRGDEAKKELSDSAEQLVALSRAELGEMSAQRRVEGFLELSSRRLARTRRTRLALKVAAALAVVALVALGHQWLELRRARTLSYSVEGGRIDPSGVIEASGTAEPVLRFSDGTEVALLGGARGQVKSVAEHGARIAVAGKVRVAVVHWRGSHWLFDAGPFLITVTGTSFTADWREKEGRLEVVLETGSIAVSGPLSDEAIALRAGQRLVISTREKEVLIRDLDPSVDPVPSMSSPPPAASLHPEPAPATDPSAAGSAPGEPVPETSNWTADLAAGRFSTILRQAEQRGIDRVLGEASSDELSALADAARYSRREDVARRALTAQRRRFPRSARANDAAFLLGRLEETAQHPELALTWYERCLDESPHGTYTSEALGRKMTVVQRLHGAASARPIAEEYLQRFGGGTYAAAARALIRAP
jgi:TolA-binding protein